MVAAATRWLEKSVHDIDALNVFPVPDGDCGTNMFLTMRSSLEEAYQRGDHDLPKVVQAMARGALMGARGNSGVILSQIWSGLARSLGQKESVDGQALADALQQAAETAYGALSHPVEGTILTVIREAATAAQAKLGNNNGDLVSVLQAAVDAAREAVANTPQLLAILREAGVVDAGGQGLYTLLEGALLYLKGETEKIQSGKSQVVSSSISGGTRPLQITFKKENQAFGYCTQFLLRGAGLEPAALREKLEGKGESLIVVGDKSVIRVHIHTQDPEGIIKLASSLGTPDSISIANMDEQHEDFLIMQKESRPVTEMAIVAVAAGDGLTNLFLDLGATAVVPGGQTMNPSIRAILDTVEAVPADKVVILPNNKNIVLTAQQVIPLTKKTVRVVPAETIPQGVSALVAYDREASFEDNAEAMDAASSTVRTMEVTRATRSVRLNGIDVREGRFIGLLDGELLTTGDDALAVLNDLLDRVDASGAEVVTLYYGAGTREAEAEKVRLALEKRYPGFQIETVNGGQPHYNYIVSVE